VNAGTQRQPDHASGVLQNLPSQKIFPKTKKAKKKNEGKSPHTNRDQQAQIHDEFIPSTAANNSKTRLQKRKRTIEKRTASSKASVV
jgi:hypothetical protein